MIQYLEVTRWALRKVAEEWLVSCGDVQGCPESSREEGDSRAFSVKMGFVLSPLLFVIVMEITKELG